MKKWLISAVSCLMIFGACALLPNGVDAKAEKEYALALSQYTIDGYDPSVSVISPSGESVQTDGSFICTELGTYKIYRNGAFLKEFTVIYKPFETSFDLDGEIAEETCTNTEIVLPKATVVSDFENFEKYDVSILKNNAIIQEFSLVQNAIKYAFSKSGCYTVRYSVVDSFGFVCKKDYTIDVSSQREILNLDFEENHSVLNTIDFSNVHGLYEGITYPVDISITTPSLQNEKPKNAKYTFNEEGDYTAVFSSEIFGETVREELTFHVFLSEGSYFSCGKNIVSIVNCENTTAKKGLEIRADGTGSYVYYNKLIDLSEYEKDDKLISFYVPYSNQSDVNDIRVSLIDANDESNMFSVYWRRSKSAGWEWMTYCLVEFNGYSVAISNDAGETYGKLREVYGASLTSSFLQGNKPAFSFTYDQEENAVYTYRSDGANGMRLIMLIDFDDLDLLGKYMPWNGFSSDYVYMKIDFLNNAKSVIQIEEIDGKDLKQAQTTIDDESYLRFLHGGKGNLLANEIVINGYKDHICKLPVPMTDNVLFGEISVQCEILKNNGSGNFVSVSDEIDDYAFTPSVAGDYKVVYSYQNVYGASKAVEILFAVKDQNPPSVVIAGKNVTAEIMTKVVVPAIKVSGGTGNIHCEISYKYNGETVEPNKYGEFFLDKKGRIEIKVSATDDVGVSKNMTYYIFVNSDIQRIDVAEMPKYAMKGRDFVLPDFTARDYSVENALGYEDIEKSVYVNGQLVEKNTFTAPVDVDSLTIVFYGGKGTDKEVSKEFIIPVIACNDDNNTLLDELFRGVEKADSALLFENGYKIEFSDDLELQYAHPLVAREFPISFTLIEGYTNFEEVEFKINDYKNAEECIVITFKNLTMEQADLYVNGEKFAAMKSAQGTYKKGALSGKNYASYEVSLLSNTNRLISSGRQMLAFLTNYLSGREYHGFESGLISLEIKANSVVSNSMLVINGFSNQNFTTYALKNNVDIQSVVIGILNEFNANELYATQTLIPVAVASDVLQGRVYDIGLEINKPNGESIQLDATKENTICWDQYGVYEFLYFAEDYYGNYAEVSFYVTVADTEVPTLTVLSEIPDEICCGTTLRLGNYSVKDNIGVAYSAVYVYDVHSAISHVQDSYTFTKEGNYKIIFYASDEAGNATQQVYDVSVK